MATPSHMIFCENTGSGTSSNGTAVPVKGERILIPIQPSVFLFICNLLSLIVALFVQPIALNIIRLSEECNRYFENPLFSTF